MIEVYRVSSIGFGHSSIWLGWLRSRVIPDSTELFYRLFKSHLPKCTGFHLLLVVAVVDFPCPIVRRRVLPSFTEFPLSFPADDGDRGSRQFPGAPFG